MVDYGERHGIAAVTNDEGDTTSDTDMYMRGIVNGNTSVL